MGLPEEVDDKVDANEMGENKHGTEECWLFKA